MAYDGNKCTDSYGLGIVDITPEATDCLNYDKHTPRKYTTGPGLSTNTENNYVPWEGIIDGKESRAASLKCGV
jgi:hypothetical protein